MPQDLLTLAAARTGHFRFESGHHGDLWLDLDRLFIQPSELHPYVVELGRRLKSFSVQAVCGPQDGGALLAHLIATELGCEFAYTSRHDEPPSIRYRLSPEFRERLRGKRVAVVDDAINTGSAVLATLSELHQADAKVVVIGALLTLGPSRVRIDEKEKIPLIGLASVASNVWIAAECPRCAAKQPLDSPE
jgi:orotate phosphoribosyltransferase